jgi:hypothetical protein
MMALDWDTLLLKRILREAAEQPKERSNACYVTKIPLLARGAVIEVPEEQYPMFLLPCLEEDE